MKGYSRLEVHDYAGLLHLTGDYGISELQIQKSEWLAGRTLAGSKLRDEGIIVLGINRESGKYIGAPTGKTKTLAGDSLIMYARNANLRNIDRRQKGRGGDNDHASAVAEQEEIERKEARDDPAEDIHNASRNF